MISTDQLACDRCRQTFMLGDRWIAKDDGRRLCKPCDTAEFRAAQTTYETSKCRQTVLFAGMDCLPGQQNLFETDGKDSDDDDAQDRR